MALDLGTSSSNIGNMTPSVLQGKDNVGAQYLQAMQPAKAEEKRLAAESGKFEGQQAQFKAQNEFELAKATALASQKEAEQIRSNPARAQLQDVDKELMTKEFIPTKENAKDLATLFSLINVIGFAIGAGGKGNAQAAMSAMNGMLEGHQQGRDDLYKKEKDTFETSMKTLKTKSELLHNRLKEDMEIYAKDREAGINNARAHIAEAGATFIGNNLDKYGLPKAFELASQNVADIGKAFELVQKDKDEVAKRRIEFARLNEQATELYTGSDGKVYRINKMVDLGKQLPEGVSLKSKVGAEGKGGANQATSLRVLEQDIGNANYNLSELKKLSQKEGELPGGSVAFANHFKGDINSDIVRYAVNQNIPSDLQAKDALLLNLAFDIASAQSGGRGQLSDAKVRAVVAQMPLDEQPEEAKQVKWGALLQRVKEANKTLPKENQVEIPKEIDEYYSNNKPLIATKKDIDDTMKANTKLDRKTVIQKLKDKGYTIEGENG